MARQYPGSVIKRGSPKSEVVRAIQGQLQAAGCGPAKVDGDFGSGTEAAVRLFQSRFPDVHGDPLDVDGEVGPRTWAALFAKESAATSSVVIGAVAGAAAGAIAGAAIGAVAGGLLGAAPDFTGDALPLTDDDLREGAEQLGCQVAALKAVAEVESRGRGFFPDKRPKILFEAHVFSKRTGHRYDDTHPAISSPRWNKSLYKDGAAEYSRLEEAIALDRTAALESASWGRFQIMGFNHDAAGFGDVESFVAAMCRSEGEHLRAVVAFIKRNAAMHAALRAKDWAGFAERYNGPGYKENGYDRKLADAYATADGLA